MHLLVLINLGNVGAKLILGHCVRNIPDNGQRLFQLTPENVNQDIYIVGRVIIDKPRPPKGITL